MPARIAAGLAPNRSRCSPATALTTDETSWTRCYCGSLQVRTATHPDLSTNVVARGHARDATALTALTADAGTR
jgi:hypothetical protein